MKVLKVHRALEFRQEYIFRDYIGKTLLPLYYIDWCILSTFHTRLSVYTLYSYQLTHSINIPYTSIRLCIVLISINFSFHIERNQERRANTSIKFYLDLYKMANNACKLTLLLYLHSSILFHAFTLSKINSQPSFENDPIHLNVY